MRQNGKKNIVILGSTGSVGLNACKVAASLKDKIHVVGVAANSNADLVAEQVKEFGCSMASLSDERFLPQLKKNVPSSCKVSGGAQGLLELATHPDVDMILCSIVGTGGLLPVIEGIKCGKAIALASKEVLVMAGGIVMDLVRNYSVPMLPVDSEHSALFQCLNSLDSSRAKRLILTASGGPFRKTPLEEMQKASWAKAIAHPVWSMVEKVSLDSATLMNKALEMVEAHYLYNCPEEKIDVVIHPQAKIHSMVEFLDGSITAQISVPDMRFPIQCAYSWPERWQGELPRFDLTDLMNMEFEKPDTEKFPSLDFARWAIREGGTMTCVMNAANEVAFQKFKKDEIVLTGIWKIIEQTMKKHKTIKTPTFHEILEADKWARTTAENIKL